MNYFKWVCSRYKVLPPYDLIGIPGSSSEAMKDYLIALKLKNPKQEEISKLSSLREELAKINNKDEPDTIFGRYVWLKEAKNYCDKLYEQYDNCGLLGYALRNEKVFNEPVGFYSIREYISEKFNEYEDQYQKELKNWPHWNLPDPEIVAREFVNRARNTSGQYGVQEIAPVMKVAADYIFERKITDLYRHVQPIVDACEEYAGSNNTKREWVMFYGRKSRLKGTGNDAN